MEMLKMHTPDLISQNVEKIAALFPNCVTETQDENGKLTRSIDFDQLRQELSGTVVEGPRERYHLDWPGKREAILAANAPIAKTLRPCRAESVDFDTTKNLFIEGDNLDALKLLQETYLSKVKLIYIDPPYNTGNDFIYDDDFAEDSETYLLRSNQKDEEGNRLKSNTEANGRFHSDWLSMMYPRLRMAKNLLRHDGVIFISIDEGELANLQRLCCEIFGEENQISVFVWEKRTTRENRRVFSFNHEYLVCIARDKSSFESSRNLLPITGEVQARYTNPDNDPRGDWQSVSLNAQGGHATSEQFYNITTPGGRTIEPPPGRCWTVTRKRLNELIEDNRVWFGESGNNVPRLKKFTEDGKQGLTPHTLWRAEEVGTNDSAKKELIALFEGTEVFPTPKPVPLIRRIVEIASSPDSIVIDFFAGSGTTAHAVMEANAVDSGNRKFILVQLPENASDNGQSISSICRQRLIRAASKIKSEYALSALNLDVGFRVLKIDTSNMRDVYYAPDAVEQGSLLAHVDNIKPDRTPEDLLFHVLVDQGVDLTLPIAEETITGKKVFFVDGNALAACFDDGISDELVKEIAKRQPLKAVFRDANYGSDSVKINVDQIFRLLSPDTEVKSI